MDNTQKVLLVDDDPLGVKVLTQYLAEGGYVVEHAKDGMEAWHRLEEHPEAFDVIISDWMMPKLDGLELLEKIQKNKALARIPVVMLTSVDDQDDVIEVIQAGAFDYLMKPVEKPTLLNMVEQAMCAANPLKQ